MKSSIQAGLDPAGTPVPADPFIQRERGTFAAGCFWGVQTAFAKLPGVIETTVGYTGGRHEHPRYEDVCSGLTGHAEAVEVVYDPAQTTFENLLDVFWTSHDPTQFNRQGPDVGSQYRSAIFFHNREQEEAARAAAAKLEASGRFNRPIVTEITQAGPFYKAEEYHQHYVAKSGQASCRKS